jgi:hypothetical protein
MIRLPAGLSFFATPYDPLDLASDSIDPLGFQRGYLALADRMLPGFTTVTSNPRYLSMLCAGLLAAEKLYPRIEGEQPARSRQKRSMVLQSFEKTWALACGLAEEIRGPAAVEGLRGIRSVRRFLASNTGRQYLSISNFNLLTNQVRYGGIGAYGQMLEACHFVDWNLLTLRELGEKLAAAFPSAPGWSADSAAARVAKDDLKAWGALASLDQITNEEAAALREGLSGGIEAETDDDVRWSCLRFLKKAQLTRDDSEEVSLKRLVDVIEETESAVDSRRAAAVCQLKVVTALIDPFEQLYQASIFLFDDIRSNATEKPAGCALTLLDNQKTCVEALRAAQKAHQALYRVLERAKAINEPISTSIALAMSDSGITSLSDRISRAETPAAAAVLLLRRHQDVQSGKFDRGLQKTPWMRVEEGVARLTSQRNELRRTAHAKSWRAIVRHPYRTASTIRFIQQCRIPA